nr:MAG TPA: hypothetical protein [Caudoviricetes sp.]
MFDSVARLHYLCDVIKKKSKTIKTYDYGNNI